MQQEKAENVGKFARYVIEEWPEGAYLFVFERNESAFPEQDHLQDTVEIAKEQAFEEFDVPMEAWVETDGKSLR